MPDPFNLKRFLDAQSPVYERVLEELRAGFKRTHWMWFVFPQIAGLGESERAIFYAISSREEAVAYLEHRILGARLRECTEIVNKVEGRSIREILGSPDNLKFCSSMTLFANVTDDNAIFTAAIEKYFAGKFDERTIESLEKRKNYE